MGEHTLFDRKGRPKRTVLQDWVFGKPTLEAGGVGKASWSRSLVPGTQRVAWSAKLDAGKQTSWDDYAKVIVPVNEMLFGELTSVRISPYYSVAVGIDMAVCIYMHDPNDFDQRIELSHTPYTTSATGYRELNFPTEPGGSSWFWYGNVTATPSNCVTEGSTYTYNQFQLDTAFAGWTIYRISFDYGYYTGDSVMDGCYLTQAQINGETIPLEPSLVEQIEDLKDSTMDALTNLPTWKFGQPEIRCDNEGWGKWESKALQAKFKDSYDTNRQFRYGNWAVHLNGGPQASEESWASVAIPINEMKVSDIKSIAYDWYAHQLGTSHILDIGPNLVWSAYDPADHSKRVDFNTYGVDNNLFMDDGLANRPIEAGWYRYIMTNTDTTESVYYYANNDGSHTPCVTDGANYLWSQYVVDTVFSNWVVYRVQIMHGYWGSTRSTGDVWIGNLKINDEFVKWEPSEDEKIVLLEKEKTMFGEPSLVSRNNSDAVWAKSGVSPLDQKSSTGWLANLYGGVQSAWDDYARVEIPVDEMHVPDLKTAKWSYYMTEAESYGVNMVIWVHDPFHPDYRTEITQQADIATLIKAGGWNEHVLNPSTDQFYFYGENTTKTNLTAAPPNYYGWDDFVADELFNTWTIYKISFDWGWQTGDNEFKDVWVADIELNGKMIPLKPDSGGSGRIGHRLYTVSDTAAHTLAPKTPFRLLSIDCEIDTAGTTDEALTITKDSGIDDAYDTLLLTQNTKTPAITSLFVPFGEGYDFMAVDELDMAWGNTEDRELGFTWTYQTVFS